MDIGLKIKQLREENGLSQDRLAEKLHVTRQAVSKWESGKGCPDIENIIGISDVFGVSLDELVKNSKGVEDKIVTDSSSKKWHILVIVFLISILVYIASFAVTHKIYMVGFGISTLFMLGIELHVYFRKHVKRRKQIRDK
jgi:transcriptional regulator with XRE-family HTH domain